MTDPAAADTHPAPRDLDARARALAEELGLCSSREVRSVVPLTGGVASDIAAVDTGDVRLCMKFALPKLKVQSDWFAPVHRNAAEYAWLSQVAGWRPDNAPKLYGRSEALSGFAMEFVGGADVYLWKAALLAGQAPRHEAASVGDLVGAIHAASAQDEFDVGPFRNMADFTALRIEPYLTYTASRHPGHAGRLTALAEELGAADRVLVHGDVSPKNILVRQGAPVLLDAECATMGDACFDPAFCLNHLLLKAVHVPGCRAQRVSDVAALWGAYSAHVWWEDVSDLEARVARLLPALMLARIDGRSPVEYLNESARKRVRALALALLDSGPDTVGGVVDTVEINLNGQKE